MPEPEPIRQKIQGDGQVGLPLGRILSLELHLLEDQRGHVKDLRAAQLGPQVQLNSVGKPEQPDRISQMRPRQADAPDQIQQQQGLVGVVENLEQHRIGEVDDQNGPHLLGFHSFDLENLIRVGAKTQAPGDVPERLAVFPLVDADDVVARPLEGASMLTEQNTRGLFSGLGAPLELSESREDLLYFHGGTSKSLMI